MSMIDALEPRRMLAASSLRVSSVTADNRGEILVQFSARATGIKGSAIQVYTAGADGRLYTSDDKREDIGFTYSSGKKLLRIVADIPKDTPYRLKLDGKTRIKSESDGTLLDGDFTSASRASGDGVAGGNYEMQVQRDKSKTLSVRMRTNLGTIVIKMRGDVAPISANAFLSLANKGKYDRLMIYRSIPGFIAQAGAVQVTGDGNDPGDLVENTGVTQFGEELPRVLSNTRGTLSFARSSAAAGKLASNQFFFNYADNNSDSGNNLDTGSTAGGVIFTPFAEISTSEGFDTLDKIEDKQFFSNSSSFGKIDTNPGSSTQDGIATGYENVPVLDPPTFLTDNTYRPTRDGLIIERTAPLSLVVSKNA